jgi:hypothetical protein
MRAKSSGCFALEQKSILLHAEPEAQQNLSRASQEAEANECNHPEPCSSPVV